MHRELSLEGLHVRDVFFNVSGVRVSVALDQRLVLLHLGYACRKVAVSRILLLVRDSEVAFNLRDVRCGTAQHGGLLVGCFRD